MEDTLRAMSLGVATKENSLNPCFNGRYSQSLKIDATGATVRVLILVLMEDTLRE